MTLRKIIETGTYTGNGTARSISIGWQPAVVFICQNRTSGPPHGRAHTMKIEGMSGSSFAACTNSWQIATTQGITLTSDGFDLGTNDLHNLNTYPFHWLAIRKGRDSDTGTWTGNNDEAPYPNYSKQVINTGRRPIWSTCIQTTNVTFDGRIGYKTPPLSGVLDSGDETFALWNDSSIGSSSWYETLPSGFRVGGSLWNSLNDTYIYYAYTPSSTNSHDYGFYKGNGNARNVVTGRQPKAIFITGINDLGFKFSTMAGGAWANCGASKYEWNTAGITITATGFSLTAGTFSVNGTFYHWWAWYD